MSQGRDTQAFVVPAKHQQQQKTCKRNQAAEHKIKHRIERSNNHVIGKHWLAHRKGGSGEHEDVPPAFAQPHPQVDYRNQGQEVVVSPTHRQNQDRDKGQGTSS